MKLSKKIVIIMLLAAITPIAYCEKTASMNGACWFTLGDGTSTAYVRLYARDTGGHGEDVGWLYFESPQFGP